MAADPHMKGRILRFAGTFDFLLAIGFLMNTRLGFHLEAPFSTVAAALLLVGSVLLFMLAGRMDRDAERMAAGSTSTTMH